MTPLSLTTGLGRKAVDLGNESEIMASMVGGEGKFQFKPGRLSL
jgi:hypothetical protein